MTLEQLAFIAEIIGGIGVVASLIYLAFEIRSRRKQDGLRTAQELTAQWGGLMTSLHDSSELAEIWLKGNHDFESLDGASRIRYSALLGRFFRYSEGLYFYLQDKTLDPMVWRGVERTIQDLMVLDGPPAWWQTRKHWFTDNFQDLIEGIIAKGDGKKIFSGYGYSEKGSEKVSDPEKRSDPNFLIKFPERRRLVTVHPATKKKRRKEEKKKQEKGSDPISEEKGSDPISHYQSGSLRYFVADRCCMIRTFALESDHAQTSPAQYCLASRNTSPSAATIASPASSTTKIDSPTCNSWAVLRDVEHVTSMPMC